MTATNNKKILLNISENLKTKFSFLKNDKILTYLLKSVADKYKYILNNKSEKDKSSLSYLINWLA